MQVLSPERSSFALKAAVSLATLAALALLGLVLAYWTWMWLAPRAEPRAISATEAARGMVPARNLFGALERDRGSAVATGIAIKLLGVVAATHGHRGYAVLQLEGREILAVAEGEDLAPGIRLAEVHPDRILLQRNGARESLALPRKEAAETAAAPRIDK